MVLVWIGAAAVLVAIELHHLAFFAMFAAAGSLAGAAIAAVAPRAYGVQAAVALAVCVLGIVLARPYVSRAFSRRHEGSVPLGVHGGIIGASVDVLDSVTDRPGGHVRLLGETWLAIAAGSDRFQSGDLAMVTAVSGTTLTIRTAPVVDSPGSQMTLPLLPRPPLEPS